MSDADEKNIIYQSGPDSNLPSEIDSSTDESSEYE